DQRSAAKLRRQMLRQSIQSRLFCSPTRPGFESRQWIWIWRTRWGTRGPFWFNFSTSRSAVQFRLAQSAERVAVNHKVGGSKPPGTVGLVLRCGNVGSSVYHLVQLAGSSPAGG